MLLIFLNRIDGMMYSLFSSVTNIDKAAQLVLEDRKRNRNHEMVEIKLNEIKKEEKEYEKELEKEKEKDDEKETREEKGNELEKEKGNEGVEINTDKDENIIGATAKKCKEPIHQSTLFSIEDEKIKSEKKQNFVDIKSEVNSTESSLVPSKEIIYKNARSDILVSELLVAVGHLKVAFESNVSLGTLLSIFFPFCDLFFHLSFCLFFSLFFLLSILV